MSQVSIIDVVGNNPQIPTDFIANVGSAVPIANTLEIFGDTVSAGVLPVYTSASGNTVTTNVQIAQAIAASNALNVGLAAFDSSQFTVDANGFVSITGSGGSFIDSIATDISGPIGPNASGDISILGFVGAAATKPIRTDGSVANTVKLIVQATVGSASSDINNAGMASFNSGQFSVDASGYVSLTGGGVAIDSIGVQTGTNPISPTGAGLVTINGAVVAAGTNPVRTDGTGANTMAVEVQISQAIAAADDTKIGLSNFSSADFAVAATGFVTLSTTGAAKTITGDSGGALSPTANNWNLLGSGSITTVGSGSTLTTQLTGLTNHAVLVGAGTTTITNLAVGTNGQVLIGSTAADPAFGTLTSSDSSITFTTGAGTLSLQVTGGTTVGKTITGDTGGALSPTSGNWNIIGSGSTTTSGSGSTLTVALTGLTQYSTLVGAGTSTITKIAPSATSGIPYISQGSSSNPTFGTAVVAGGGTGNTTFTAYSVIAAGTTATGAFQNVSGVGTAGQVLTSAGAGALPTWAANAAFTVIGVQTITATGAFTYTPTAGTKYAIVELVGGGGASGGVDSNTAQVAISAGGASGGYLRFILTAAQIGASLAGSVGAASTAGTAGNNAGANGNQTFLTMASTWIAAGGNGSAGGAASSATIKATGGSANANTVGTGTLVINMLGNAGGTGWATLAIAVGGKGGDAFYGQGGNESIQISSASSAGNATNGYGAGGGGASSINDTTDRGGGAGGQGIAIFTEFG